MNEKELLLAIELIDAEYRLQAIHNIRMRLLDIKDEIKDDDFYITSNELLNELERNIWKKINKKKNG